ncbi:hypothetical protein ACWDBD_22420 [Streptomyces sp. NPDC001118]|uniref:hypothetical protein n=1 Tax=Streptomyces sp. CG4 TaxID=408783 RepID=UPI0034E257FA
MGYWPAKGALAGRGRLGREHVVVTVPPAQVRPVVTEGLAAGAHCFTVITSGGDPAEERAPARETLAHGARLLGPHCMGLVDTGSELRRSSITPHPGSRRLHGGLP